MKINFEDFLLYRVLPPIAFGGVGVIILYATDFFKITSFEELYKYILSSGFVPIFFSFIFILVSIYCWIYLIISIFDKPKKDAVYLESIENGRCEFVDRRGKVYRFHNDNYEINRYYDVIKTFDNIIQVLNPAYDIFVVPKKRRYWF